MVVTEICLRQRQGGPCRCAGLCCDGHCAVSVLCVFKGLIGMAKPGLRLCCSFAQEVGWLIAAGLCASWCTLTHVSGICDEQW